MTMIVCLCKRVSDRDIREAVSSGERCFEQLREESRLGSSCGCCLDCAREVFETAVAQADQRVPVRRPVVRIAAYAG